MISRRFASNIKTILSTCTTSASNVRYASQIPVRISDSTAYIAGASNTNIKDSCDSIFSVNTRLSALSLNAAYLSGKPLLQVDLPAPVNNKKIKAPSLHKPTEFIVPVKEEILDKASSVVIEEPNKSPVKKHAVRMIKLRRKKMKKHQRIKLWKRMYTIWRKKWFNNAKRKEYALRHKLIEKVQQAMRYDPKQEADEYLRDYHEELTPLTWKGKRKPIWLIKELIVQEKLREERDKAMKVNIVTKEPLIREGETVEDFVKRNQ